MSILVNVVEEIQQIHDVTFIESSSLMASQWQSRIILVNFEALEKIGHTDEEVIAAFYHEVGHVLQKMSYSDDPCHNHALEYNADLYSAKITNQPEHLINFILRIEKHSHLSHEVTCKTHPSTLDRAYNLGLNGHEVIRTFNQRYKEENSNEM